MFSKNVGDIERACKKFKDGEITADVFIELVDDALLAIEEKL